jgi:hypothetical protein
MCCVYLFIIIIIFVLRPSVAQNIGLWRRIIRWFVNAHFARTIGYEAVLSHLRHYPGIYLEKLSKTTRCLSKVRRMSVETRTGFLSNSSNKRILLRALRLPPVIVIPPVRHSNFSFLHRLCYIMTATDSVLQRTVSLRLCVKCVV